MTTTVLDSADAHIAIDGRRKPGSKLDPFPHDPAESRERKSNGVGSGSQVDDLVVALTISHDAPNLLDQRRAAASTVTPGRTAPVVYPEDTCDGCRLLCRDLAATSTAAINTIKLELAIFPGRIVPPK